MHMPTACWQQVPHLCIWHAPHAHLQPLSRVQLPCKLLKWQPCRSAVTHIRSNKCIVSAHQQLYRPAVSRRSTTCTAVFRSTCQTNKPASKNSLDQLEAFLGYHCHSDLLEQACTYREDGTAPLQRQLALVGDATLWMLFAEHAFTAYGPYEDPLSGAWPSHMSALLSRASCSAVARQWGLQHYVRYLPHQSQSQPPQLQQRWSRVQLNSFRQGLLHDAQATAGAASGVLGPFSKAAVQALRDLWPWTKSGSSNDINSNSSNSNADSSNNGSSHGNIKTSCDGAVNVDSSSAHKGLLASYKLHHSSSRISRDGNQMQCSSDCLAEMVESVVGALLLDSRSYKTVRSLLQDWVAAAFDASRAAAPVAAVITPPVNRLGLACPAGSSPAEKTGKTVGALDSNSIGAQDCATTSSSSSSSSDGSIHGSRSNRVEAPVHERTTGHSVISSVVSRSKASRYSRNNSRAAVQQTQCGFTAMIHWQLKHVCGYTFSDETILHSCSANVLQLVISGSSSAQADAWHFLGYSLLQFAAVLHACGHSHSHKQLAGQQQQHQRQLPRGNPAGWDGSATSSHSSSSGSSPVVFNSAASTAVVPSWNVCSKHATEQLGFAKLARVSSCSSNSDSDICISLELHGASGTGHQGQPGSIQQISRHVANLKTIRHRCKMWLWLGLDPAAWCPPGSKLVTARWKQQKQLLSRCLDVLLAAVYQDGGMDAAVHVAGVLLAGTPPTTHCKDWIPAWARNSPVSKQ